MVFLGFTDCIINSGVKSNIKNIWEIKMKFKYAFKISVFTLLLLVSGTWISRSTASLNSDRKLEIVHE